MRKIGIPLQTPVLLYKSGVQGGIYIIRTCFRDVSNSILFKSEVWYHWVLHTQSYILINSICCILHFHPIDSLYDRKRER